MSDSEFSHVSDTENDSLNTSDCEFELDALNASGKSDLSDTIWDIVGPKDKSMRTRPAYTSTPKRANPSRPAEKHSQTKDGENSTSTVLSGKRGTIIFSPKANDSNIRNRLRKIEENQATIINMLKEMKEKNREEHTAKISRAKINVPHNIRVAVRDSYTHAKEKGESWTTEITHDGKQKFLRFDATVNMEMTRSITASVLGLYPNTKDLVIKEGIRRYFTSLRDKQRRLSTGKDNRHKQKMVMYGRKKRKLENRKNALGMKRSWSEEKKRTIKEVLVVEMMSSEEEVESDNESHLSVKVLQWRSKELNTIFSELDKNCDENKTKKAKRMELKRVRGDLVSTRALPEEIKKENAWAFN